MPDGRLRLRPRTCSRNVELACVLRAMCGRITLSTSIDELTEALEVHDAPTLTPRYNIAPSQQVAVIRRADAAVELAMLRWGFVPSWAKDPAIGYKMINAKSETVSSKPAFRAAFRSRRCVIPADGFYEWQKSGSKKQPYLIRLESGAPFALAGVWEQWNSPNGEPLETFSILTTEANEQVKRLHDRMPVMLTAAQCKAWLDPNASGDSLDELCLPSNAPLQLVPVSTVVNNPRNDDPSCIVPTPHVQALQGELF